MMVASFSLRALSVLQFYATKRIIDTATRIDLHAARARAICCALCSASSWSLRSQSSPMGSLALLVPESHSGAGTSSAAGVPVCATAHPTYFDNMLTGKVAHRAMLLPEQTVTLFERANWDYLPLIVQCALLLVLFFRAKPFFAFVLLAWLAVYIGVTGAMGCRIAAFGAVHSEAKAQLTGRIVDSITNIKNVISLGSARERRLHRRSFRGGDL